MAQPRDYVELRARSAFFLEAASNPEDLALAAAELGYPALALADRDSVCGAPRFHRAAKAAGLQALVGAEVAVEPVGSRTNRPDRLLLLVESAEGWRRLCRLLTLAHARRNKHLETRDRRALRVHPREARLSVPALSAAPGRDPDRAPAGYFLIVEDITSFAARNRILCQGRGSAANSAVCHALGITAVDPVRMDLLFERFLSEERGEWPDIDIDLPSGDQREKVIQYVFSKYGTAGSAMTANVITYQIKLAVREMGKVLSHAPEAIDRLAKLIGRLGFPSDRLFNREGGGTAAIPSSRHACARRSSIPGPPVSATGSA